MTFSQLILPLRQAIPLLFSARVSGKYKLIPLLALVYILSPLDFIPDFFVGFGQLDDLMIIFISLQLFARLATQSRLRPHPPSRSQLPPQPLTYEEGVVVD